MMNACVSLTIQKSWEWAAAETTEPGQKKEQP